MNASPVGIRLIGALDLLHHGWTRVIAEVFHIDIPTSGPRFDELVRIAAETR